MNTTTIAPEVQDFLDAVRAELADLDPDEQRDITEGLEADLTDLVAERGRGALGDPVAYARELRAAAGLEPEPARMRARLGLPARVHALLDESHRWWDRVVGKVPGDLPDLLAALRPVWWVLRGWVAVEMAAMWLGDWSLTIVPGGGLGGVLAVLLGVAVSFQLGLGRLWPDNGWRRIALLRVALVALNCYAVAMIPTVLNGLDHGRYDAHERAYHSGFSSGFRSAAQQAPVTRKAGLYADGIWVSQIYPYDAKGRPLVGVQLFNQVGQPIKVVPQEEYPQEQCSDATGECAYPAGTLMDQNGKPLPRVYYPWTNGTTQLLNVFPIPSRVQQGAQPSPTAFAEKTPPSVGPFPLASVPKVSLPGIKVGVLPADR